jgi:hypothetical protein
VSLAEGFGSLEQATAATALATTIIRCAACAASRRQFVIIMSFSSLA